mmetsp:Transcript_19377/g.39843  ORF Transcript_19377/g.39843 Transcript_19377/m.39843 type:complete len:81 (+) Transcript_19377:944-1186(+)
MGCFNHISNLMVVSVLFGGCFSFFYLFHNSKDSEISDYCGEDLEKKVDAKEFHKAVGSVDLGIHTMFRNFLPIDAVQCKR